MSSRPVSFSSQLNEKLEPLFTRLNELSRVQRISGAVVICVLVGVLFVYFGYAPRSSELQRVEDDIRRTEQTMVTARKAAMKLEGLKAKREAAQARFDKATRALPEQQEIPELLSGISAAGKESGLEFQLFQPGNGVTREFYEEIPVAISVVGSFHQIVGFFDRVARLNRIVNLEDIGISTKGASGILSTKCRAVTYRFVDQPKPATTKRNRRRK